jgi:molybdopterin-guanine dinucleotide biosynthesis protein A
MGTAASQRGSLGVLGIFAGGMGTRMGGRIKGRLLAPHSAEMLVERLARIAREVGLQPVIVGGGEHFTDLAPTLPSLMDAPPGIGPLGGLRALLAHAHEQLTITVASDMPYVTAELLLRLAHAPSTADVLLPRDPQNGLLQPYFARYQPQLCLPKLDAAIAAGVRSYQQLLKRLGVEELALTEAEWRELRDWDRVEDMALTDEQHAELERRLDRVDVEGPVGVPWEDVSEEMKRR